MTMKNISFLLLFNVLMMAAFGQRPEVEMLTSGTKTSLRGLSVVNDNIIWVSGSNGMVGRSVNAGKNWNWMTVNGFEKIEFRDIEAFDGNVALIMGVGEPGYILKTNNGGETWKVVYENRSTGIFMDAMDFSDNQRGMVIGDPLKGKVFMATTTDSGNSWTEVTTAQPAVDSGEAFFAASGTNLRLFKGNQYFLVSGGTRSRLITTR